ncbi:structural constituent of ribosome, partial [Rhizopus stolonifer]
LPSSNMMYWNKDRITFYDIVLEPTEEDIRLLLAASCHLGTQNVDSKMKSYVFTRRPDARMLVTVKNPQDIYIISSGVKGFRPAAKLAHYVGAKSNQGRFVPGTLTNSLQEPLVLVCLDPFIDFQAIKESSYCNVPVIAFCNSHSSLRFVDMAIPCNNIGTYSIGVMAWLLARTILRLRGQLSYTEPWSVIPDMFFYSGQVVDEEEVQEQTRFDTQGNWAVEQDWSTEPNWTDDNNNNNNNNTQQQQQLSDWDQDTTNAYPYQIQLMDNNGKSSWEQQQVAQAPVTLNEHAMDWAEDAPEQEPEGWGSPAQVQPYAW